MDDKNNKTPTPDAPAGAQNNAPAPQAPTAEAQPPAPQAVADTPTPQPSGSPAGVEQPKAKNSNKLMLFIGLAIALLFGGAAAAYTVVAGTPENKIKASFAKVIDAKELRIDGSADTGGDVPVTINMGAAFNTDDKASSLTLGFATSGLTADVELRLVGESFYVKAEGAEGLGALASLYLGAPLNLEGLDGQWFKIDDSILDSDKTASCAADIATKYGDDDRKAIKQAYNKFPLFDVEEQDSAEIDGKSYSKFELMPVSSEDANKFLDDVKENMPLVSEYSECYEDNLGEATDITDTVDSEDGKLYAYLDGKTLKRLELITGEGNDAVAINIDFSYGDVNIETPEDTKDFAELISGFLSGAAGSGLGSTAANPFAQPQTQARDTVRKTDINAMYSQLESFHNENGYYPETFTAADLPGLDSDALVDPDGRSISFDISDFSEDAPDYTYDAYGCENNQCMSFSIDTALEGSPYYYSKESLN